MTTTAVRIMTDVPLPPNALGARQQHPVSTPFLAPPPVHGPRRLDAHPLRLLDGGADDEDDGEIICICKMRHDDGFSVQCETCNNWQHMICYYPNESDRPGEHQKHYCFDCQPRWLDEALARERQEKQLRRQALENGSRRPGPKGHRKKAKESLAAVNGWSADKHQLLQGRDRKSQSPRDLAPPAKRPKTTHRSSVPANQPPTGRRRNGTMTTTRSTSPDQASRRIIPWYSDDFCHLYKQTSSHVETQTNLMNNIAVTNSLSEWLKNPDVVEKDTNGLSQNDIFQRWDGPFEDMPGRPEVALHWEDDHRFSDMPNPPRWPCLTVEQDISKRTFIGELRGHIGYKEDYMNDPDSRWSSLRHVEPFVFFHPQLPIYIDARQEGTVFRYARRSCRPNAELQTIITDGTNYHFCFMATKDLLPGEEITVAWQTDDTIKAMYAERGVVHGDVPADIKYAIAMWVSNVLANCGPCACNGEGCLMARFDRRGQPQPLEPAPAAPKLAKPRKKKLGHNISPADQNRNSNSRSGSEVHRLEQDDDMTDARSVSGSYRGSASRDMTPNGHCSSIVPEMSERERKKLMREEEMFRRQEEESGRQKKKRNSGASSLQPPGALSASNSSTSKQPSEPSSSRRNTISKRTTKPHKPGSKASPTTDKPPRPLYVDCAIQCDMDNDVPPEPQMPTPPKRKQYLSVTQRLLRRCASNNLKRKAETPQPSPAPEVAPGDTMDVDKEESPKPNAETSDVIPISPISIKAPDVDMGEAASPPTAPLSPAFGHPDEDMRDPDDYEPHRATPPLNDADSSASLNAVSPRTQNARIPSHPPMDPPPPPWSLKEASTAAEDHSQFTETNHTRPEIHLAMPPPSLVPLSSTSSGGSPPLSALVTGNFTQSPAILTPGISTVPLFSPSIAASVNPSPARKKMSLSDYTKRSKAHKTRDISPSGAMSEAVTGKDKDAMLQGTAVSDSPASETMPDMMIPDDDEQEYVPPG